jgi:AAA15 family ATPase/GTPase
MILRGEDMLHQFTFKNFKSFKDEMTLDLLATSIKEHPEDVVTDSFNEKVLKVAAIYGANASGKSNVIDAFNIMKHLVLYSFQNELSSNRFQPEPFWFEDKAVPTEFSVIFSAKQDIFQYGFSIGQEGMILEEYLYQRDSSRVMEHYLTIFDRTKNSLEGTILDEIDVKNLLSLVESNTLILSVLSKLKLPTIQTVFEWFKNTPVVDYGNPNREFTEIRRMKSGRWNHPLIKLIENPKEKKQLENFIRAIDIGIAELGVIEESDGKSVVAYHQNPFTKELLQTPIESESSGTIKMLMLYVNIKQVLDNGGTIFIDELDTKLHPLLIRYIIIMFHDQRINPNHAQLIFSTQEVFTLDKDNLRRDEIWFTDKSEQGVSELYSLVSYVDEKDKKIRNDASYGKDYILGRYRSIPSLKRMEEFNG